jgi:membrane-associated phospholipid phosphatase
MSSEQSPIEQAADALLEADAAVADAAEEIQQTRAVRVMAMLSEIGDQPQMRALAGGLVAVGLFGRNPRLMKAGVRMLAAHELATFLKNVVKNRVDRTRPRSREDTADAHKIRPGDNHGKEETSFPSGHSAGAAASARAFTREFPEYKAPALAAAGGVALAQIPRCAHYPTDVGAGIAVGLAAEAVVAAGWRLLAGTARRD